MESKYDRVEYPENVYLHSDGETEEFGTGVYPISVISRRKFRDDTIKIACIKVKRKFQTLLIVSVILLLLLIITIAVTVHSAVKKQTENGKQDVCSHFRGRKNPNDKDYGLFLQPVTQEGRSTICYSPRDHTSYLSYVNLLHQHMNEYTSIPEFEENFVDCINGEQAPQGKTCRYYSRDFGTHCTNGKEYGYIQGRPCVLLVLRMKPGDMPEPFDNNTSVQKQLGNRWSPNHIAVTCDGKTAEDRKYLVLEGKDLFPSESAIFIQPSEGFSLSYFPNKGDDYVAPGVMVAFNELHYTNIPINVKCVAWGKNFNNGTPQSSKLYSIDFQLMLTP